MGVVIHIDKFSGPMALLLHLIRKEEMDIFDINIQEITKQYLETVKAMKKLDLEVAGDFIAMAATLIQIKSKMLLPQYNESGDEIETEDPRKDLVNRLLEYQMYQEAGQNLYGRNLLGRDQWRRGFREEIQTEDGEIVMDEENALFALISTYRTAIRKMKKAVHKVSSSLQSIADRIWQMRDLLVVGQPTLLSKLVACGPSLNFIEESQTEGPASGAAEELSSVDEALRFKKMAEEKKGRLLITFLSLLELAKIGLVNLFQGDNFAEIHVNTRAQIDKDAISNVENYESQVGDNVLASQDIWMNNEEDAEPKTSEAEEAEEVPVEAQRSFFPADNLELVEAATDEEIELEEQKYGEENQEAESQV